MNEIEIIRLHVDTSVSSLKSNILRYYDVLYELRRMSTFLFNETTCSQADIDKWFKSENFGICEDGFWQSISALEKHRQGKLSKDAISYSCHPDLRHDKNACFRMYLHRNIGRYLANIKSRLPGSAWIYYQDSHNIALQYPFIDQSSAITPDFDWSTYHTWISVVLENNPDREIKWTDPSIDYAGEGLIISVSIPVYWGDAFAGLWSIDLPMKTLYQAADEQQIPEQQDFISDYHGNIITHPYIEVKIDKEKGSIFQENISSIGGEFKTIDREKLISSKSGQMELSIEDGRKYDVIYKIIPEIQWIFYSIYPKDKLLEVVNNKVKSALDKVRSGDYSYRLNHMQDDFNENILVTSYNEMAEALEVQHLQIQDSQKRIIQAEKNSAIGTLAGGIAHDFNNILSAIIGFTEIALEDALKGSSQEQSLKEVYIAGMRAKELVQQILAFARQSSGEVKPVRLSEIIAETLKLLRPLTPSTIDIVFNIKSTLPVNGNVSQLHQIILNLCTNAVYSLQELGGVIKIELKNRFLENYIDREHSMLPGGEYVELTITDNGPGIDPAIIDCIFEPYFTTKGVGEGTGIGLAMVKGIIKSYKGDIQVRSEPGNTTFIVILPVAAVRSVDVVEQDDIILQGTGHILFVDDEPPIARMGCRMLEGLGYKVTIRTSSFEALELFKTKPDVFDLVITDMTMPSMTGDVLSIEIRKIRSDIPIILCTGYSRKMSEALAKHIGINAFVYKPFTKSDFAKTVRAVLES
ncbi:ATP-binding protein [Desulfocicer niacini]